jgi:AraC-like DNA-binding protein
MGRRASRRQVAEPTVRIGTFAALPAVLRSLDADPEKLLAEAGVDLERFDNPDNRISFSLRARMIAHCAARTACPHFGLLVGEQTGLDSLGFVGLLTRSSPDVQAALRSLERYWHFHARGAVTTLAVAGHLATLSYEIYQPRTEAVDQTGDGAVAVMFNILRELCGPEWMPVEVRFAHREPKNAAPFRRFFLAPLRFDAEQYSVVFSATWLKHRLPDISPELRRLLQQQVDKLEARSGDDFPAQVRSVLRTSLVTGHSAADQVAVLFSVNRRTMNRRLGAFGIGFQVLVDETRFEIARQMLEDSSMSVIEIATLLDYADASAFTRAFRRWSGTTPAQWRATMKGFA